MIAIETQYESNARRLKALADPNRLRIVDILSCGERCACEILENFDISQPTLSHHMKILTETGLVQTRRDGVWTYYSLDPDHCGDLIRKLTETLSSKANCICEVIVSDRCARDRVTVIPGANRKQPIPSTTKEK